MIKGDILNIDRLINESKDGTGLIDRWFFLFEITKIRLRIKSNDKNNLEERFREKIKNPLYKGKLKIIEEGEIDNSPIEPVKPFSCYKESKNDFFNEDVVLAFANLMSEISGLAIKKFRNGKDFFNNLKVMERIFHCIFNNLANYSGKNINNFAQSLITLSAIDLDFENKF